MYGYFSAKKRPLFHVSNGRFLYQGAGWEQGGSLQKI